MKFTVIRCDHKADIGRDIVLPCAVAIERNDADDSALRALAIEKGWLLSDEGDFCSFHRAHHERPVPVAAV